jgi:acetyl-CoA carboxylase carboxyl transferase subunit beta
MKWPHDRQSGEAGRARVDEEPIAVNWINNVVRPKIRGLLSTTKREVPDNLWVKCPETGQMVFYKDLEANQFVVPGSDFHMRMSAQQRFKHFFDGGEFKKVAVPAVPQDPLKFRDGRKYADRLKDAKTETELDDAVLVGEGTLDGMPVVAAAQDFRFMAGSLGMAAGEAVITGMLRAVELKTPFILFAASGGARMQEGILSLMQMPRTTIAVQRLREARLPYIAVLTDPTTGGVTASYAMLGDVHIAEPGALICFAGPRVIQQTIREQLPEGFQRSEYLLAHGMVDMVVHRHKLRETIARLCSVLMAGVQKSKGAPARINGSKPYVNGTSVDGKLIETAARASGGVIEPEPVPSSQRFDPARSDKTRREDVKDPATAHKDAPRGS